MLSKRKGSIDGMANKAIIVFITIVLLFKLYSTMMPTVQDAGDELNASGVTFGDLFVSGGITELIIMAGLLLLIVRLAMANRK